MIMIVWIVLILNILSFLINFLKMFAGKSVGDRVTSFIACTIDILICIMSIYVLKL